MQLQSLNSLCSSNAVWHRFWTENWPKQYTAKGRAQDRKNRSKFVGSGKEGPERASQTFFIAISNILFFFPNSHPWPNFSLSYFSSGSHIPCPINVFANPALYFVHNGSYFPGIPFQTLRKDWPLDQGLHPLLSNYPLPVKYRNLSTSSQIPHCILLFWFSSRLIMLLYNRRYWGHSRGFRGANLSARQERGRKREK